MHEVSDIACNEHEMWKYLHHILCRRNAKFQNVEASGKYGNYCFLKNIPSMGSILPFNPFKTIVSAYTSIGL
jgi:hypothetical protein